MLTALLVMTLASPPAVPTPKLFEAHLPAASGLLLDTVEGAHGGQIFAGVRLTVSGSILLLLGGASAAGGIAALLGVPNQTGTGKTALLALGWTFTGLGMLFGAVGIPLLIVGIANLAGARQASLTLTQSGELAVAF